MNSSDYKTHNKNAFSSCFGLSHCGKENSKISPKISALYNTLPLSVGSTYEYDGNSFL